MIMIFMTDGDGEHQEGSHVRAVNLGRQAPMNLCCWGSNNSRFGLRKVMHWMAPGGTLPRASDFHVIGGAEC